MPRGVATSDRGVLDVSPVGRGRAARLRDCRAARCVACCSGTRNGRQSVRRSATAPTTTDQSRPTGHDRPVV